MKKADKERMYNNIKKHGENLNKIFKTGIEPVTLCKKLFRLENIMNLRATEYCNGEMDCEDWESLCRIQEIKLDKLDNKIIKELVKNPRINYLRLANLLKVSHETIRYRISNYVKKEFITTIGLFNDFKKHGYFMNYLFLKLKTYNESLFKTFLDKNPHIFYSARLVGEYNCIIYILAKTPEEFSEEIKKIRNYFKDKILDLELLYFEKTEKNVQFPELLLE